MRLPRFLGFTTLAAGVFAASASHNFTLAQATKGALVVGKDSFRKDIPRPKSEIGDRITKMKAGEIPVDAKGAAGKQNLADLRANADYLLSRLTHKEYFSASIERRDPATGKLIDLAPPGVEGSTTIDSILTEFSRSFVLPNAGTKLATYDSEYIIEYGKVVDAAILAFLAEPTNPNIVKLNLTRALTVACKAGAPAHAKTVLGMLTDSKTPWFQKYEALKAAENLIGASDVMMLQGPTPYKHSIPDKDLAELCNAIETVIKNLNQMAVAAETPTPPPAPKPGVKPAEPAVPAAQAGDNKLEANKAPELDADVALYIRKQAVRALSKVRMVTVPGPNRSIAAKPGLLLARYAVKDPSIMPVPSTVESAEAAMGLAGMYLESNVNVDVYADAIMAGVGQFGGAKSEAGLQTTESRLVAWKKVAAQLASAMNTLKASPDKNPVANSNKQLLTTAANTCLVNVLTPIETMKEGSVGVAFSPAAIDDFRLRQSPRKTDLLIQNDATSKVTYPNKR